jgi:hypothetical protein
MKKIMQLIKSIFRLIYTIIALIFGIPLMIFIWFFIGTLPYSVGINLPGLPNFLRSFFIALTPFSVILFFHLIDILRKNRIRKQERKIKRTSNYKSSSQRTKGTTTTKFDLQNQSVQELYTNIKIVLRSNIWVLVVVGFSLFIFIYDYSQRISTIFETEYYPKKFDKFDLEINYPNTKYDIKLDPVEPYITIPPGIRVDFGTYDSVSLLITVVSPSGNLLISNNIEFYPKPNGRNRIERWEEKNFVFTPNTPGIYKLTIEWNSYPPYVMHIQINNSLENNGKRLLGK